MSNLQNKYAVFDIDGTITKEGNDSWLETTQAMVTDTLAFQEYLKIWKEKKSSDPFGASHTMMEQAIGLFPEGTTSLSVYEKAKQIAMEAIENLQVRENAISTIEEHFNQGLSIVFATTSYMEAGLSLVDALFEKGLLNQKLLKKIVVSGTEVDWATRKIIHFNMSDGKLEGVAKKLDLNLDVIEANIEFAYGDDPYGSDSGIIRAAKNGFVIHTEKNSALEISNIGERVRW